MHFDFARKWTSLQSWSHWDLIRQINTQLFPLLVCLHFYFTQNLISSLFLILGFIFTSFNFKIRNLRSPRPEDPNDPMFYLKYKERLVYFYSFLMCFFFLFLKFLIMTTVWFNFMSNLSEKTLELVTELKTILIRITPFILDSNDNCQKDMILLLVFMLYLGLTYLFNRKPYTRHNHYSLQIALFSVNKYFSGSLLLVLVVILFVKVSFLFTVSLASFLEAYLVIYSIINYWFSLHRKSPKSRVKFVRYIQTLSILRILLFITFLTIKQIGNTNFSYEFLSVISPELVAGTSNRELALQLAIYLCSSLYCWCCKFRANFNRVLNYPLKKNIRPKSRFIKYFAKEFFHILQINDTQVSINPFVNRKCFQNFQDSKHFLKFYRKAARANCARKNKNNSFIKQAFLNAKYFLLDIINARYFLGRFLILSSVVVFLAVNSFTISLFSVLNYSLILVIILFPRLTSISNCCLVLSILPHFFFMVTYTLLFIYHYSHAFPKLIFFFILKMLSTFGMETAPDKVLSHFLLHFKSAFLGVSILIILRIFFKNKTQKNTLITKTSIFFFFTDIIFYLAQFLCLSSILIETLIFPNICNLLVLVSMYIFLLKSTRSAKVVAWTMLFIFTIRFFSRYKLIFGFFQNTSNLFFGLYYNIKQVLFFSMVNPSPENVYYFNLTRMLLLLISSKHLSEKSPIRNRLRITCIGPLLNVIKNIMALLSSIKVFFVYFSVFFLALFSERLSYLQYAEICYCSFLLLLDMLLFKSHLRRSSSFFIFFFSVYFLYSLLILLAEYFRLFSNISTKNSQHMENFYILLPLTIKLIFSTISIKEFLLKFFDKTPNMVSTINIESNYYLTMRLLSVFLREILLFYTLLKFLQNPNLFKVIYLGSYLFYFCYQISDLAGTLNRFQLRKVLASKVYYFHTCLIANLSSETPVPGIPNGLFRKLFPHFQLLYSNLFSRAIFKSLYGVIKRTWILLFLSLLFYLQALFFLEMYFDSCKANVLCRVIFNLNFETQDSSKSELFQVVLVLMITVAELYFVNLLRSKQIPNERKLVKTVGNLCIGFFQFRATAANKSLQDDLRERFKDKHAYVIQASFNRFKEILDDDSDGKIREFAKFPNQMLLQISTFHRPLKLDKEQTPPTKTLNNLSEYFTCTQKTLMISQNKQKMIFLQAFSSIFSIFKRITLFPLLLGILASVQPSPFRLVTFVLIYYSFRTKTIFNPLRTINISIAFLSLLEFGLLYYIEFKNENVLKITLENLNEYITELREHPLSGLPYIFLYTSLIKFFFLLCIFLTQVAFVHVDRISLKFRNHNMHRQSLFILNFDAWRKSPFWIFEKIKKFMFISLVNFYFILCTVFYLIGSQGLIIKILFFAMVIIRLVFLAKYKMPLLNIITRKKTNLIKLFLLSNWVIMFFHFLKGHFGNLYWLFEIEINMVWFSLVIVLGFVILDCSNSEDLTTDLDLLLKKQRIHNYLSMLNLSYDNNENEIFQNVKQKLLVEHFEKKCEDPPDTKKSPLQNKISRMSQTRQRVLSSYVQYFKNTMSVNEGSNLKDTSSLSGIKSSSDLDKLHLQTRTKATENLFWDNTEKTLRYLSLFPSTERYKTYLKSKLSLTRNYWLKLKVFILKRVNCFDSPTGSFYTLVSRFLTKNQVYTNYEQVDLLALVRNDFKQLEALTQKVENNSTLFRQMDFKDTVCQKIKEIRDDLLREEGCTVNFDAGHPKEVHLEAARNQGRGRKMAQVLFQRLMQNRELQNMVDTPDNSFYKNWFKIKTRENEYIVLKEIITPPLVNYQNYYGFRETVKFYSKFLLVIIRSNFETCLGLTFLFFFCYKEGAFAFVYAVIILLLLLTESRPKNHYFWKTLYILFIVNFLVQLLLSVIFKIELIDSTVDPFQNHHASSKLPLSLRTAGVITFLYGSLNFTYDITLLILFEITFIFISSNLKAEKFDLSEYENPSQALFRLSMNEGFRDVYTHMSNRNSLDLQVLEGEVRHLTLCDSQSNISHWISVIKRKTGVHKFYRRKFDMFLGLLEKLSLVYNRDRKKFNSEKFKSFFWRVFSYRLRKSGINLQQTSLFILVSILLYFFFCYHHLENDNTKDVMSIINNNTVQGTLGVNFTLILLFICVERFMYSKTNTDWLGGTDLRTDQTKKLLAYKDPDLILHQHRDPTPYSHFRRVARKVFNARLFIRKLRPESMREEYQRNPLIKKAWFSFGVFVYLAFLAIFWLPQNSVRTNSKGIPILDALFCNNQFKLDVDVSLEIGSSECNNFASNPYLQFLFVLACTYMAVSCLQVKKGFSRISQIRHQELEDVWQILKFYFYKYTPFIREMRVILDYTSSPTSLNLFQWFKLEDIETTIKFARVNEKFNFHSGQQLNKHLKRFLGFSFLVFFFLLLIGPLYLFSDIIPSNSVDHLRKVSLKASVSIDNLRLNIFENKQFELSSLSSLSSSYQSIRTHEKLRMYELDLYRQVELKRFSESYFKATSETLRHVEDTFGENTPVSVELKISMSTDFQTKLSQPFQFVLAEENSHALVKMLTAPECNQHSGEKIILGEANRLIMLKKLKGVQKNSSPESFPDLDFLFVLKFNCDLQSGQPYFELFDENHENLQFIVLQENITESVEMLARLSKNSNISLVSVYVIIFSYIGLTVIRSAFFGMAHRIWTIEIPNAHQLEEHIFLIAYNRARGDFFSEARFYYELVDLFRAPEEIKKMTGSFADRSWRARAKENSSENTLLNMKRMETYSQMSKVKTD